MKIKRFGWFSINSLISIFCTLIIILAFVNLISNITKRMDSMEVSIKPFSAESRYKILYITSIEEQDEITKAQLKGFLPELKDLDYSINIEKLSLENTDVQKAFDLFGERIYRKMRTYGSYDAVVCADDPTLWFCLSKMEALFPNTPIFFLECLNPSLAFLAGGKENVSGTYSELPIFDIIVNALIVNPNATEVVAVIDSSMAGDACKRQFYGAVDRFPGLKPRVLNLSEHTLSSFSYELSLLNNNLNSIVIYFVSSIDREGNKFSMEEINSAVKKNTQDIPVYTPLLPLIKGDYFAGTIINFGESASYIGKLVYNALVGNSKAKQVEVLVHNSSTFYVNYQRCNELGIERNHLPKNYEFVNYPFNFFREYHEMIIDFLVITFAFLLLIIVLIIALRVTIKTKKQMQYAATHDYLTDLLSRKVAFETLESYSGKNLKYTVAIADLDDFKRINDFYSHVAGDEVLKEIASRLLRLEKEHPGFRVCRFGGDEFGILYEVELNEQSKELQFLKSLITEPVFLEGIRIPIKVSIGVVVCNGKKPVSDILTEVDLALNEAKKTGPNKIVFFSEFMKQSAIRKNRISGKLEEACATGSFEVHYQPQVDILSGDVHGYEALVRLSDFSFTPGEFIPVAEEVGCIARLGRIITEKVIIQIRKWKDEGRELKPVSINFSTAQMGDVDYVNFLTGLLYKYDIPANLIVIEITESLFLNDKQNAVRLSHEFRELGIKLALDDFGTGYSSLSYLTFLPVDTVKIDKSMVDNYLSPTGDRGFIKNLLSLVHDLGMKLTVEGVETREQYDLLKQFGADYIQGYYFSRPVSADNIEKFTVNKELL